MLINERTVPSLLKESNFLKYLLGGISLRSKDARKKTEILRYLFYHLFCPFFRLIKNGGRRFMLIKLRKIRNQWSLCYPQGGLSTTLHNTIHPQCQRSFMGLIKSTDLLQQLKLFRRVENMKRWTRPQIMQLARLEPFPSQCAKRFFRLVLQVEKISEGKNWVFESLSSSFSTFSGAEVFSRKNWKREKSPLEASIFQLLYTPWYCKEKKAWSNTFFRNYIYVPI